MTAWQVWAIVGAVSILALVGVGFMWRRMTVYRWYCSRCKKIVSAGRLHPRRCTCDTNMLVAYFCRACASWNTSPTSNWHCSDCSSKKVNGQGIWATTGVQEVIGVCRRHPLRDDALTSVTNLVRERSAACSALKAAITVGRVFREMRAWSGPSRPECTRAVVIISAT